MFFYVHGFNSVGQCRSAQELSRVLQSEVVSVSYDCSWHFDKILNYLCEEAKNVLPKNESLFVLGSSLGGFYALHMGNKLCCPCVAFNPVTLPQTQMLPLVGFTSNYYTKKEWEFTLDTLNSYTMAPDPRTSKVPRLIIVGSNDELLAHSVTKSYWQGDTEHAGRGGYGGHAGYEGDYERVQILETNETHQIADYGIYLSVMRNFFDTAIT